jgi:L-asparagine transporter-like permease
MAVTTTVYGLAQKHFASADINWASDTIKVALLTSTYTPNQDTHEFFSDLTNELSASGNYSSGGASLAGKAVSYTAGTNTEALTATNLTLSALTPSAAFRYAVVYKSTGTGWTSQLICYINFGADQNPGGSDFTLSWAATGVLNMTTA